VARFDSLKDVGKRDDRANTSGTGLLYSKATLGNSLAFETYASSGIVEVPEMDVPAHVLIQRCGSPSEIEWRSDGRDRRVELPAGTVSLLPAGYRRAARVSRPFPGVASILQISPEFLDRGVAQIAKGGQIELVQRIDLRDSQIQRLMESLRTDIEGGAPTGVLFGQSIATALSVHIAQQYSSRTLTLEPYRGGLSRSTLNRVREYIHAHVDDKLELETLAKVAGVNLYHFAKAFKQSTGETPHQYVLRQRIEQAKQLLRRPKSSVLEASARAGFVDQSHFSKVFRRMVGVAPSAYRSLA
jgi:AraC family transcriptional regulator